MCASYATLSAYLVQYSLIPRYAALTPASSLLLICERFACYGMSKWWRIHLGAQLFIITNTCETSYLIHLDCPAFANEERNFSRSRID